MARPTEDLIDEALAETFPASDPPAYMAGSIRIGAPMHGRAIATDAPPASEDAVRRRAGVASLAHSR